MAKYIVGTVKETPPGTQRDIVVADLSIALYNVEGTYYALLNRCPHQGAPLAKGMLVGRLESERPGRYSYDPNKEFVKCCWHGWEFDLATGKSWFDPERKRVKPYPVTVEHGETIHQAKDAGAGRRIPGPYLAEVFPVSVEDEYVVIEVGR